MAQKLNIKIVPLPRIQVATSRLRRNNIAAVHAAVHLIRKYGQPHPLIVGPDYRLLSDTVAYLALMAARYDLVKVFQVTDTSPTVVRAVGRLLVCAEVINREAEGFNAALASLLASLDRTEELDVPDFVRELLPVMITGTGELPDRGSPSKASDADDRTPLKI
ncbi:MULTISPECIES: hypothetical protein [unclassified Afipia]|uniref:hypothetical protein n=1 Tax=unclassified Afipia TaxID=2642050 RepID=UPI000405FC36|nr:MULTISPECIES: hypothetical protein [unclassified Afipia]